MIDVLCVAVIVLLGRLHVLPTSTLLLGLGVIALRVALDRFEKAANDLRRRRALDALQARRIFHRRGPYR
jgi:hypothetical protein